MRVYLVGTEGRIEVKGSASQAFGSWLVTVTAQDRPGVIATIAGRQHGLGCSVVIASTEIVAGQASVMVIASAQREPLTSELIHASLLDLGVTKRAG